MKIPTTKNIFGQSLVFFLAIGINRGLPVLLTPILTVILTPTEYGYLGIASIILGLLRIFIGVNPTLFITTKYFTLPTKDYKKYLCSIFQIILVTFFITLILFLGLASILEQQYELSYQLLIIISLTASFMVIESIVLSNFQMNRRADLFLKFSFLSALLQILMIVVFLFIFELNWKGKLIADLISSFIIASILIIYFQKQVKIHYTFSIENLKKYITFSLPLFPHSISIWAMSFVDRIIIERITGISEVGQYSVAYNLGLGFSLIFEAAQRVWQPYFYEYIEKEDIQIKAIIIRYTWIYFLGSFFLYGLSQLIIYLLFPYFIGDRFLESLKFIPLVFLGYTFHGLYRAVASYLYYIEKTNYLMIITLSTAIINILLNIILVNMNGTIGAAQSTFITYLLNYVTVQIVVVKVYNMPWFTYNKIIKNANP